MTDPTLVQVLDAADEFLVELGSLGFVESRISDDKVKELASVCVLHDHKELLLRFDDLDARGKAGEI